MKSSWIIAVTIVLAGCGRQRSAPLTADQAKVAAVRLANFKASQLYKCEPFSGRQVPRFDQGRWVWSDRQGCGAVDIEATVELSADGSTNSVDVKLLDNRAIQQFRF